MEGGGGEGEEGREERRGEEGRGGGGREGRGGRGEERRRRGEEEGRRGQGEGWLVHLSSLQIQNGEAWQEPSYLNAVLQEVLQSQYPSLEKRYYIHSTWDVM